MFSPGDCVVIYHKKTVPYVVTRVMDSEMCGQLCEIQLVASNPPPVKTVNSMNLDQISKIEAAALLGLV